ncbi:MAG: 4-hydroxythreonine-4-phosphate dehydrogenase PdxA [Alphaproteobacteria bacterium]
MPHARPPLALTMGEPSGIAGEIVVKAWKAEDGGRVPPFVYIGDAAWLRAEVHHLRYHVHVIEVASPGEAVARFAEGIPVLPEALPERPAHGWPVAANAKAVIASIRRAVDLAREGACAAVVTNPIHKASLYSEGFSFPGHTEYLAHLTGASDPVMMLSIEGLKVVPVTVHLPLATAITRLSAERIIATTRVLATALRKDFGIAAPRIAVAGLNPHAGEDGTLGREEIDIIKPAVAALKAEGIVVSGPLPADTLFHAAARARHDAAVCMYHDQALIPLKTLDFHGGVNTTLGLPLVRTSPDHGTAFDIAGQGLADPSSLLASLRLADRMARTRAGFPT